MHYSPPQLKSQVLAPLALCRSSSLLRFLRPVLRSTRCSISNSALKHHVSQLFQSKPPKSSKFCIVLPLSALAPLLRSSRPPSIRSRSTQRRSRTHQIHSPPDQMISHTRTILTPTPSNQHHRMLLHIMSFPRNVTSNNPPGA
jgi:hypothetical protein